MEANLLGALLGLGVLGQAMLLGANAFEAVVDVPNWRDPKGLLAYRAFICRRNAGHFYRVLSPVTIVLLASALAWGWSDLGASRALVAVALGTAVAAEAFTAAYFFPRNRALFTEPVEQQPGPRSAALVAEWGRANTARIALVAAGVACALAALGAA